MSQRTVSVESNVDHLDREPSWARGDPTEEGDERSFSRRRSLECSSLEIQIVDTEPTQHHTDYIIRITCGLRSWIIKRRYSDFYYLDKQLKRLYPTIDFPNLPPKRYLRSSSDPEIVDQRKEQLEEYLNGLVKIPQVWIKNDFVMFLNDNSNLMIFIWNFERIRRLQDMLKSTKVENESSAAQLNLDLENARSQVQDLQHRLSHMEMIFLQQALGVAGEQLPTSVIRSISYSDNALSRNLAKELTEEAAALYAEENPPAPDVASKGEGSTLQFGANIDDPDEESDPLPAASLMKALNLAQTTESEEEEQNAQFRAQTPNDARTIAVSREFKEAIRLSNEILSAVDSPSMDKSRSEVDLTKLAQSPSISTSAAEATLRSFNPSDINQASAAWVKTVVGCAEQLVSSIAPTAESIECRFKVFLYIRDLVARTLGAQLFPVGSFVTHTFLPDGDVGATAFVPKLADDSLFVKLNEALCLAAFQGSKGGDEFKEISVSNVSFVNTEIKMIRSMINGVSVDISTNQLNSLFADSLLERVNEFVGQQNLFKRSLVLLKAWFNYESPRFTHGGGSLFNSRETKMNSWVIAVLLIWTFNAKGKEIAMPLQALSHFFEVFNQFDWAQYAWTVSGPVSLEQLTASSQQSQTFLSESFSYLPPSLFDFSISDDPRFAKSGTKNRDQRDREKEPAEFLVTPTASTEDIFGEESNPSPVPPSAHSPVPTIDRHYDGKEVYRKGILNIIDPFDSKKNLLEGLEATGCELLVSALRDAYQSFQAVCEESSKLLGFGQFSTQKIIDEVERLMKTFFLNTSQKYLSNADTLPEEVVEGSEESRFDSWAINREDLQFSLSYGRMALGGKIDLQLLTQLVLIILEKKGTMPVGEIGKNLQSLMGCESLSKRLKEQFSGLKRAIENSNSARIKMGNEHPFNPTVSLLPPPSNESQSSRSSSQHYSISASFHHADYLFVPYNYQVQMQAAAVKELHQAQQQGLSGPRQNRHYYRRPAPVILETHSLISQSSSLSSSNGEMSPDLHHYRRSNQPAYRPKGGSGAYLSSPSGNRSYFRGNPNQMPHQGSVFPLGVDVNGIPIPPPSTYGFPSVPIYPPPIYGHPPPPFYPPQMHNSLSSSVSSSYGQTSPMSQSPMNPSYLLHANFDYPPPHNTSLPSHPGGGSPNPRINNNNN